MDTPSKRAGAEFDAADAFALLGDETRVAIVRALAGSKHDPMSFADLRERVGVEDSGRFNYHLGKLVDTFVEKVDEGYRLTYAGSRVVGAVYEGAYAAGDEVGPIDVDGACPTCGGGLNFHYADEYVRIECRECGKTPSRFGFPPGAIADRDPTELPGLLNRYILLLLHQLRAGFCINCSGPIEPRFDEGGDDTAADSDGADDCADDEPCHLGATFECDRCHERATTSLSSILLTDPATVAFHYDHGVDIQSMAPWSLAWTAESESEQVSESPPRYAVTTTLDDERLRLVVDEQLQVVEATRSPVSPTAAATSKADAS